MADPPEAIVLILDAGASTVAWARDALPPAEVGAALGGAPAAAATSDDGDNGGEGGGAAAAHRRSADPMAGPANPRVFEILRSAAMRLVATRFCYCSKQDRLGALCPPLRWLGGWGGWGEGRRGEGSGGVRAWTSLMCESSRPLLSSS